MARARSSAAGRDTFEGVLSLNPRGFGFVAAAGKNDVFVPPDAIGGAMHGDRVLVAVTNISARGSEGRIERVVTRRNPRVAGVLRRKGRSAWLEPDDSRIRGPVVLGAVPKSAPDGAAAVVTITRFPEYSDENPEGELLDVLGAPGDPNVEVRKILVREEIEEQHPDAAVREAEAMAARLRRASAEKRRDLRDVPLPTIDPEDARDHDDAVWVEKNGEGYRAYVAIADVSEYVQPGSALDDEALERGCTIYLPDRAIPMLPAALAADLCSLLPEQERLTLCVIVELDRDANVVDFEIVEGVMRSHAMLTYGGVAKTLGFTEAGPTSTQAEALKKGLRVLDELSRKLRRRRMQRGALDLDLPEARVILDPKTGAPTDVVRRAQDPGVKRAYSMIEELMLLANETVARFLGVKKSPGVYRVHAKPDAQKLERLGNVARKLGVEIDLESLSDPLGVSRWLAKIQKHPRKNVLEMLLLRSLKQAVYDTNNVGHFGLASEAYVHFTSPIRRYPDVEVHRAVKRLLRGGKPDTSAAALEALAQSATRASTRERAAMEVEREVVDLYRTLLMRDRVGETHEGTVTALVGSGVYVSLDSPFVDVLIRFEGLGPDRYESSEDEISVVGVRSGDTISLGDRLFVTIEDVAVLRRTVYARRVVPEATLKQFEGERREDDRKAPTPRREQRQIRVGERRGPGAAPVGRGARPSGKSRFGQRDQANRGGQREQANRGGQQANRGGQQANRGGQRKGGRKGRR
ncbi:MAG TPA: ribonuclease R [Polyangiaceae bacterium]|nr:ribonuclease R [Polyangiaceae bacterium]